MSDNPSSDESPKTKPRKGDKVEVVRILILAVVSFVLGFGLVIFFLGPSDSKSQNDLAIPNEKAVADNGAGGNGVASNTAAMPIESGAPAPNGQAAPLADAPSQGYGPGTPSDNPLLSAVGQSGASMPSASPSEPGATPIPAQSPEPAQAQEAAGAIPSDAPPSASGPETAVPPVQEEGEAVNEANAPPEVPPGKTPDNVALDGGAFYLKCLDKNGAETKGASCDKLPVIEKRIATRLYVVDRCRKKASGDKAVGKLSLGVEVDFDKPSVNYWNGPSSTLENAAKAATCLRTELNGLPIRGAAHKYSRYRMFFTVLFGSAKEIAALKSESGKADKTASSEKDEKSDEGKPAGKGKLVKVLKDQVRVRKTPVDGDVIGKIGKDNEVKLLKKKGEWCQVLTPNNNEGWMICEALSK